MQLRCGIVVAGAVDGKIDAEILRRQVANFHDLRKPHHVPRDRKLIVPCHDVMVPAAMNRVEFQQQGMLL